MTRRATRALAVLPVAIVALVVAFGVGPVLGVGPALGTGPAPGASSALADAGDPAQAPVGSCTTIDESGTYVLSTDIENGGGTPISGACIEITADDVTFDGGDRTIGGRGVSHTKAVAVVGAENVTVRNVAASDWHAGVLVTDGSATVRGVHVSDNAYGVRLANATGSAVENSTVSDNLVGVYADPANVTLADNDLSGNAVSVKQVAGDGERDDGTESDDTDRRLPAASDDSPVPRR